MAKATTGNELADSARDELAGEARALLHRHLRNGEAVEVATIGEEEDVEEPAEGGPKEIDTGRPHRRPQELAVGAGMAARTGPPRR